MGHVADKIVLQHGEPLLQTQAAVNKITGDSDKQKGNHGEHQLGCHFAEQQPAQGEWIEPCRNQCGLGKEYGTRRRKGWLALDRSAPDRLALELLILDRSAPDRFAVHRKEKTAFPRDGIAT